MLTSSPAFVPQGTPLMSWRGTQSLLSLKTMGSGLMKDTPVDAPCPRGLICLRSFKYDYITPNVPKALELNCLVSSLKD